MKKIISIFLALALTLSLSGCGEINKAEKSVKNMFSALKNVDFEEAEKYVHIEDIEKATGENELNDYTTAIMENVFNNLEYEVISSEKVDSKNVTVKTKITATDMKPVLGEYISNAMQYAFSNAFSDSQENEEETDKKMQEILVECLTKPDLKTVTNDVDIKVVKTEDGNWEIDADEKFANAIMGGLIEVTEEINSSMNNLEE